MTYQSKKTNKKRKIFWKIMFFVCLAGFLGCALKIAGIQIARKTARDTYSSLRQEAQSIAKDTNVYHDSEENSFSEAESLEEEKTQPIQVQTMDFDSLHELSSNIVGWVLGEGTNVDYPVVQGEDNDTYLYCMYNGGYNASGSIFLDCRNENPSSDRNLVIYGHYINDGSMFQSLTLYKHADFFEQHPTMKYYAPEGDYIVELICGSVEDANQDFLRFTFESDEDLQSYVEGFRSHSTFQSDVTLKPGDRIISMCTCSYEKANARYLVIGRLVPVLAE